MLLKKKYYKIYIIKLYDNKKTQLKKKIKFKILLGFESKHNKNYLNIINTTYNSILKNKNDLLKINKNLNYIFSLEKTNPYILNITKLN